MHIFAILGRTPLQTFLYHRNQETFTPNNTNGRTGCPVAIGYKKRDNKCPKLTSRGHHPIRMSHFLPLLCCISCTYFFPFTSLPSSWWLLAPFSHLTWMNLTINKLYIFCNPFISSWIFFIFGNKALRKTVSHVTYLADFCSWVCMYIKRVLFERTTTSV